MRQRKEFKTRERLRLKALICEKTGYYIRSNCLFEQIFTRSSYAAEHGGESNELLEFIGDQVLGFYVAKILIERFGALNNDCEYTIRVRENRLSVLKQEMVNNETLAAIVEGWDITKYLAVGKSDFANAVDEQMKVKADLFEAILGAIAVGSKWDPAVLEKAVVTMLSMDERLPHIVVTEYRPPKFDIENAVVTLKELAEHGRCQPPRYEYGTPEKLGYDEDGNPRWECTCHVITDKTGIIRQVWTNSKKAAKKAAAYLVLCDWFELQNEHGVNGKYLGWTYKDGKLMPIQK